MNKIKKYGIIIQARFNSTRLPGKVLKYIGKYTVLEILIKRLRKLKNKCEIIVATSNDKSDDKISNYLEKKKN